MFCKDNQNGEQFQTSQEHQCGHRPFSHIGNSSKRAAGHTIPKPDVAQSGNRHEQRVEKRHARLRKNGRADKYQHNINKQKCIGFRHQFRLQNFSVYPHCLNRIRMDYLIQLIPEMPYRYHQPVDLKPPAVEPAHEPTTIIANMTIIASPCQSR